MESLSSHELRDITLDYVQLYSIGGIEKIVLIFLCENYGYYSVSFIFLIIRVIESKNRKMKNLLR
jgi:hypothetical protein